MCVCVCVCVCVYLETIVVNSYCIQKWTQLPEGKFRTMLFAFTQNANILSNGMNQIFLPSAMAKY